MAPTQQYAVVSIALAVLCCSAVAGASEEMLEHRADRWLPSIAMTSAGLWQDRNATAATDERGSFRGSSTASLWSMGIEAAIATPVLFDLPGRPRLVARGGFLGLIDTEEPVVNEGDPGTPEIPDRVAGGGLFAPLASVRGRGTAARVEAETVSWAAGLGISFETIFLGRVLRVTPSLEYQWQEDRLRGVFGDAETVVPGETRCDPNCRTVAIDSSETQDFHSIGPGFEIELEAGRYEGVVLSLFFNTQVLRVIGDRDMKLSADGTWTIDGVPDPSREDTTLDVKYQRDAWHYRAGIGFRATWLPEPF